MFLRNGQAGAGAAMLFINERIQIPDSEFDWSYARSGGPGGQNVNKVASKAVLRWAILTSPSLPGDVRARFMQRYHTRITGDGDFLITSQEYRDQERNRQACLDRLTAMLLESALPPRPRRATKPTKGSQVRRVAAKRKAGQTKSQRRRPAADD